jgi:hypothetical protein
MTGSRLIVVVGAEPPSPTHVMGYAGFDCLLFREDR